MNNVTLDALEYLVKSALDNLTDEDTKQTIIDKGSLLREALCDFASLKTVITWNLELKVNFTDGGKTEPTKAYVVTIPSYTPFINFATDEWESAQNPAFYLFEDILNNDYEE